MKHNRLTYVELNPKYCSDLLLKDCAANTYRRIDAPLLSEMDSKNMAQSFIALFRSAAIDRKRGELGANNDGKRVSN